ncbi:thioredoxin domain-containing protein [Myxococcota bacterium]|nr:thioredoxin domain-containing protein [Myxococcota bacterium]
MQGNLLLVVGGVLVGWTLSGLLLWKDRRLGIAMASAMGLLVALYLGAQHLDSAGASLCSINQVFDCDKVNRSQYSEVMGIPIALLGAGFYAAVLAAAVLGRLNPDKYPRTGSLVLAGAALSVVYSAFLAWASVKLGAWCLLCISMYGVNLLLLVGGWTSRHPDGLVAALGDREDRSLSTMLTAGLVVFVASMGWYNMQKGGAVAEVKGAQGGQDETAAYAQLMEQTRGTLTLDGTEPVLGDPGAPYTVVEFADFECPACASVTPMMHELVERNPNVKVVFKQYPLSNICNPNIGREFHKNACRAASAAECAHQQGRFWDMTYLLFKNQTELDADGISFMAEQVGLDAAAFTACMGDPSTLASIQADVAAGERLGIDGTPALFLHGIAEGQWVALTAGPEGAELLVRAHAQGKTLPPPPPPAPHDH